MSTTCDPVEAALSTVFGFVTGRSLLVRCGNRIYDCPHHSSTISDLVKTQSLTYRSPINNADTMLPAGRTPGCRGSSKSALAVRILNRRLLA